MTKPNGYRWQKHVWDYSPLEGYELLAHLAMASYANSDTGLLYASANTLANAARASTKTIERARKKLLATGEIEFVKAGGPKHPATYRLIESTHDVDVARSTPDIYETPDPDVARSTQTHDIEVGQSLDLDLIPESSTRGERVDDRAASKKKILAHLVAVYGKSHSSRVDGIYETVAACAVESGHTPDQVLRRARRHKETKAKVHSALWLIDHWDDFGPTDHDIIDAMNSQHSWNSCPRGETDCPDPVCVAHRVARSQPEPWELEDAVAA